MVNSANLNQTIEEYSSVVFKTCRKYTSCRESAWDAYQETFLAFSKQRASLDLGNDLGPWLRETARRCSLAVVRHQRRQLKATVFIDLGEHPEIRESNKDRISLEEISDALKEELKRLPPEDRLLIRMIYHDGRTHREIARDVDCPPGSVFDRIEKTREKLRRQLKKRGLTLSVLLLIFLIQDEAMAVDLGSATTRVARKPLASPHAMCVVAALMIVALGGGFFGGGQFATVADDGESMSSEIDWATHKSVCASPEVANTNGTDMGTGLKSFAQDPGAGREL